MTVFKDNTGVAVNVDDVVFDGKTHWQLLNREGEYILLSCQGYKHDITVGLLRKMRRIGKFEDNQHLFNCD